MRLSSSECCLSGLCCCVRGGVPMSIVESIGRPKDKLVQRVLNIDEGLKKMVWPQMWSEKIDGVYCFALWDFVADKPLIYSRTGEEYLSMNHIADQLRSYLKPGEVCIFEAFIPGAGQEVTSGAARDTKQQHPELKAYINDLLTWEEFTKGGGRPYKERWETLYNAHYFGKYSNAFSCLQPCIQRRVDTIERAQELAEEVVGQGGEGIVLRNPDAPYEPGKRTTNMTKIKKGVSYDLEVVGVYEGNGKYFDTLGGLQCRFKNGEILKVSGMTDAERDNWWKYPYLIIGKIVQIDAMAESSKGKLREPRFKGIRYDKATPDF